MIITDLYKTEITSESYNVDITNSTGVTITVTLKDFSNHAVTGKPVVLTCSSGYFENNTNSTTLNSINLETNSEGKATIKWFPTDWGLCTFSANNSQTQVRVTGVKRYETTRYKLWYDDKMCHLLFNYTYNNNTFNARGSWTEFTTSPIPNGDSSVTIGEGSSATTVNHTLQTRLSPHGHIVVPTTRNNFEILIQHNGVLAWKYTGSSAITATTANPMTIVFTVSWKRVV